MPYQEPGSQATSRRAQPLLISKPYLGNIINCAHSSDKVGTGLACAYKLKMERKLQHSNDSKDIESDEAINDML